MSWRDRHGGERHAFDERQRSPVWEPRRSPDRRLDDNRARYRDHRYDRERIDRRDRTDRFDRPERNFERNDRGFDRSDRGFERNDRGFERNDRGFERNNRSFDRSDRGFDRNRRSFDRNERGVERTDRVDHGYDRSDRNIDRTHDSDRFSREDQHRSGDQERSRERSIQNRETESPRDHIDVPQAPSPPKISRKSMSPKRSRSRSGSSDGQERITVTMDDESYEDRVSEHDPNQSQVIVASVGDWLCKCGSYNFKRRHICYRHSCNGTKKEGTLYGTETNVSEGSNGSMGITKRLLFRRLDALTTEEKILEAIKERCTKEVVDSIAGITIGREPLTGASKCLAYINFNSISDSSAAYAQIIKSQLTIDNRHVLVSYYNEPVKPTKKHQNADYATYCAQYAACQAMSEADRVNAAAAVAQSAISAAQKRNWTPNAPTFVSSSSQAVQPENVPTGDGSTKYSAPDVRTFMYDETSGYYYDPATGLYYDGKTQYFFNNITNKYMYWDADSSTYKAATQQHQNTDQPKLPSPPEVNTDNTIVKEPEERKKKDKDDKVKVAKKIAKDMERWAKALNQKKENAKNNVVAEQVLDTSKSKGSADIGFSVLGAVPGPSIPATHLPKPVELSPPPIVEEYLPKNVPEMPFDSDENVIDWAKLTCLLCKRRFPSAEVLTKHKLMSDLHKQNLAEYSKSNDLMPQMNGYRDRAAERRMKFGEDDPPPMRKRYEPQASAVPQEIFAPPPSVVDTIGGKMLQKMGWSQGRGLGKEEQGRIAPIEAQQRPGLAGLGQKKGIYTPTPGETYRDTVKKLMIARYKEVVGQDDDE